MKEKTEIFCEKAEGGREAHMPPVHQRTVQSEHNDAHRSRGKRGGRGRCKTGHTGSNNTGVKCATIPFMSCRHRTTSVGVRVVVFEHPVSGWLAWAAAGSGFGSKSVLVMRL